MRIEKVNGIILNERSYKESSKILDIMTKEFGIIGVIGKGSKSMKSKLRSYTTKLTYAEFKRVQLTNNYAADIFDGVRVRFNNTLPAYGTAAAGAVYAIVGDFDHGTLANYPSGDGVDLKFDDKTLMTSDLIRILGRQYVGVEAIADKAFTLIAKPE